MKVILREEVPSLGDPGEVVAVSAGYARNYLLPRHLALPANAGNVALAKAFKKRQEKTKSKELADAAAVAERIERFEPAFERLAGETDKIFGSVTTGDIAQVLADEKIVVDKRKITIETPIDALGSFKVSVKLHPAVTATMKLWVVAKKS